MPRAVTVDASVFVSALSPAEVRHEESFRFMQSLNTGSRLVILPTLVKPEIAGALNRSTHDADSAREAAELSFLAAPIVFVDLDRGLAEQAAELAIEAGLRGADAVYAATARRFDATLVTLDTDQRTRLPADISALYPWEVDMG